MWLTASILAWTRGGSPTLSPGTDAGRVCPKALHDAEPTKHTQPFTEGKGFGDRDNKLEVYFKNRLFLQAETALKCRFHGTAIILF